MPTPAHLRPESCYVCGWPKDQHENTGHAFWSNTDAAADFAQQPQGPADVESRYVAEHRPY